MKLKTFSIAVLGWLLAGLAAAQPQPYPSQPVHVLVGFPAGGTLDIVARQIGARLQQRLGTPIVIENRPGASGTIAAAAVARAEPDGYTLLFGAAANLAVAPATMKSPPYDPATAFTPIVEVARGPYLWLVPATSPARTMKDFVEAARARPGRLNYATPGQGTPHHLATEALKRSTATDMVQVPYGAGIYPALLGGEVEGMFDAMPGPLAYLAAGRLRALAVTGSQRLAGLPAVPTLAEQGYADVDVSWWWGLVGPAGLPQAVVEKLNEEIARVLAEPELEAVFARWSIEPKAGTAKDFGATIARESRRWKDELRQAGFVLE